MALVEIVLDFILDFFLMFTDKCTCKAKMRHIIFGCFLFIFILVVGLFLYDYLT